MIRIVGILTGSAVAIATLLLLLGVPEFLPEPELSALATPPEPASLATMPPEQQPVAVAANAPETSATPEPSELNLTESLPAAMPEPALDKWYAFWSPFQSELAANGFVSTLQRNTGIDYRVVKVKTGVYEVAFAYRDDADIPTHLAAISAATGLDLPGG